MALCFTINFGQVGETLPSVSPRAKTLQACACGGGPEPRFAPLTVHLPFWLLRRRVNMHLEGVCLNTILRLNCRMSRCMFCDYLFRLFGIPGVESACFFCFFFFPPVLHRATSLTGTGAVMLRTEPASLSLPGPFGAAGFHPRLSQRQRQACCDRSGHAALCRAVACAPCTPVVKLLGCKESR